MIFIDFDPVWLEDVCFSEHNMQYLVPPLKTHLRS